MDIAGTIINSATISANARIDAGKLAPVIVAEFGGDLTAPGLLR